MGVSAWSVYASMRVGDLHRKRARVVIAEFLHHSEEECWHHVPLLGGVDTSDRAFDDVQESAPDLDDA